MAEILVVGAGPAGLAVAIKLARAGQRVTIVAPKPTDYKLGECVPGAINRLLASLELPLLRVQDPDHQTIGGTISLWAGELRCENYVNRTEGGGWRVDRKVFENSIANVAKNLEIGRHFGHVRHLDRTTDQLWEVVTDANEHIEADFVVDATGRGGILARKHLIKRVSDRPLVALWMAGRASEECATNRTLLESTIDGWWYAAFLPDDRPIAIFHTSPEIARRVMSDRSLWRVGLGRTELISQYFQPDIVDGLSLQSSDARSFRHDSYFGEGWAACGDAAFSFDPIASQGIFNAMSTSAMLADCLNSNNFQDSLSLWEYQSQLNQIFKIYQNRRTALYESARLHFRSSFWEDRCS